MTRHLAIALVLIGAFVCTQRRSFAQIFHPPIFYPPSRYPRPDYQRPNPEDEPFEMGGYLDADSATYSPGPVVAAGTYAQWNRFGWCPGLDLRLQGGSQNVRGVFVGPRLAYQPRGHSWMLRPYVAALFGPNELSDYGGHADLRGVTTSGVVGVDIHFDSYVGWRVLEYSKGEFTGIAGVYPQTISTGIVFHIP